VKEPANSNLKRELTLCGLEAIKPLLIMVQEVYKALEFIHLYWSKDHKRVTFSVFISEMLMLNHHLLNMLLMEVQL
jgi:hypothetical protein